MYIIMLLSLTRPAPPYPLLKQSSINVKLVVYEHDRTPSTAM